MTTTACSPRRFGGNSFRSISTSRLRWTATIAIFVPRLCVSESTEVWGRRGSAGGAKLRFAVEDGKGSGDMGWVETVQIGAGTSRGRREAEMGAKCLDLEGLVVAAVKGSWV
ncbi:hypothetical protein FH972_003206 [Carpinus fangiana]|uniref:Uncharacterized protein n=1 Tax=Carpinus fangiana TaxID=176857 RepID=A0A5N6QHR2_9ROSI|nr:hypothetical protein FH972_003206 [Carpinus fangiana]